jgi:hypothetical protein
VVAVGVRVEVDHDGVARGDGGDRPRGLVERLQVDEARDQRARPPSLGSACGRTRVADQRLGELAQLARLR